MPRRLCCCVNCLIYVTEINFLWIFIYVFGEVVHITIVLVLSMLLKFVDAELCALYAVKCCLVCCILYSLLHTEYCDLNFY